MKIRTFLITLLALTAALLVAVYTQRAGRQFRQELAEIEALQRHSVARYAATVLASHEYFARAVQRKLESDSALGKLVLLASKPELDARERNIRAETKADVVTLLPVHSPANVAPFLSQDRFRLASDGASAFALAQRDGEPWLVGFSPIHLYEDVVGVLLLAYRLNGAIRAEIADAAKTPVAFALPPLGGKQIVPVDFPGDFRLPLVLGTEGIVGVSRATRENVLFWGVACLLALILFAYAVLELGFVRRFRLLLDAIRANATALNDGEIRELAAPPKAALWEVRKLWEAIAAYTSSLKAFRKRIEEKSRVESMGKIADQVAHDLRSPLAALRIGLDETAIDRLPEAERALVTGAMARIDQIVEGLRRPSDTIPVLSSETVREVQLAPLVDEILSEKRAQYREHAGVTFAFAGSTDSHARLQPGEMKRVLSNLVDNSVQALTGPGRITVRIAPQDGHTTVEVEDTGAGIPPAVQARLFERGCTFGKKDGSGLGLWHARESLKSWGGDVAFESQPGIGTKISLLLPACHVIVAVLFLALAGSTFAAAASLPETLINHQVMVDTNDDPSVYELGLLLDIGDSIGVSRDYLERLIRFKFESASTPIKVLPSSFPDDLIAGRLDRADLLRPKLVVTAKSSPYGIGTVEVELIHLVYRARNGRFVCETMWERKHRITGLAREESLVRLLQRELGTFAKTQSAPLALMRESTAPASYRLDYVDKESLSSLFSVGATTGAPFPLNVRAAYWGSRRFPVVLGISGTYMGTDMRGVSVDAGYALSRSGRLKHALHVVGARLSDSIRSDIEVPAERGLTTTRSEIRHLLRSYVGPAYSAQWGDFFLMAGTLVPVDRGSGNVRLLVNIGYMPLFIF